MSIDSVQQPIQPNVPVSGPSPPAANGNGKKPEKTTTDTSPKTDTFTSGDIKQEALKLEQELNDRAKALDSRASGAAKNYESTKKELDKTWFVGKGALKTQLETEKLYKERVEKEQKRMGETQARIKDLMKQAKEAETGGNKDKATELYTQAKAVMEGKEQEYKSRMKLASDAAMGGYKEANKQLKDTDRRLGYTETALKVAGTTAVVVGATVATGGTATAFIAGYGVVGGSALAIGTGTLAGTAIGALRNTAKASVDVGVYGKDARTAFSEAASQTLQDGKSSLIASVGTMTGMGAGGVTTNIAGKIISQGAAKIVSGSMAGVANAAVTTGVNTTEARIKAEQEFTAFYGEQIKNMSQEQVSSLKQQFLEQRGLTTEQILKHGSIDLAVGAVSGGQGAKFGAMKDAAKSTLEKAAITGLQASGSTAVGLGAAYLKDGEITAESAAQNISNAVIGDLVGGMAAHPEKQSPSVKEALIGSNGTVFGVPLAKSKPPVPNTSLPQTPSTARGDNSGHTNPLAAAATGMAIALSPGTTEPHPVPPQTQAPSVSDLKSQTTAKPASTQDSRSRQAAPPAPKKAEGKAIAKSPSKEPSLTIDEVRAKFTELQEKYNSGKAPPGEDYRQEFGKLLKRINRSEMLEAIVSKVKSGGRIAEDPLFSEFLKKRVDGIKTNADIESFTKFIDDVSRKFNSPKDLVSYLGKNLSAEFDNHKAYTLIKDSPLKEYVDKTMNEFAEQGMNNYTARMKALKLLERTDQVDAAKTAFKTINELRKSGKCEGLEKAFEFLEHPTALKGCIEGYYNELSLTKKFIDAGYHVEIGAERSGAKPDLVVKDSTGKELFYIETKTSWDAAMVKHRQDPEQLPRLIEAAKEKGIPAYYIIGEKLNINDKVNLNLEGVTAIPAEKMEGLLHSNS